MDMQNRPAEIESWDLVMVYDRNDGRIFHSHHTVTWRGGEHPSREERERAASEHAEAEAGVAPERFAFLHTDPSEIDPYALLRVDPETGELVVEGRV